jgi:predicted NAD-dependent protein-ADP-ribosyltransferase YbiA (DUF1768 family)
LGIPVNKGSLLSEVINITDNYLNSTQITPQQKQEAQQLYSSYLQTTNNPTIEGFKQWNNRRQQVNKLFDSDSKLANAVYEALGFGKESNLPTGNETINIYAGSNQNTELSNFAIRPFTVNVETLSGEKQYTFQSVEQGFHFHKALVANNPQVAKQILATTNGGQLKRLTNRSNLKMTPEQVKEWDDTSKSIMLNLMYDSYAQNPKAAEKLLATGNAKITHEGPYKPDRWTKDFPDVVMTVRDMLKEEGFGQEWINTNKLNNKSFGISLNIAGNGIYTLKGKYTQEEVDEFTYKLLKAVVESPELENKILSIRTGGQTGFDEAGAKAGMRLGIPTMILAPKGWKFRNAKGQDISDEKAFKDRFKEAAPTEKAVPLEIFKTAGKITHVKLKDGKKYKVADVKSAMMEKMGYTPAEIGKILKKLC